MKTELNWMGRIRLFPMLFQTGCSQSTRFLPQARRIVGSGDENAVSPGDMAVRMSKILARLWIGVRVCHLLSLESKLSCPVRLLDQFR